MKVAVLGAGLMGRAVAWDMLGSPGAQEVRLFDANKERLRTGAEFAEGAVACLLDAADATAAAQAVAGCDVAVSCVPYHFNELLTAVCIEQGVHFVDLGGNSDVVDAQFRLDRRAREAGVAVLPDCGLAPGLASIYAMACTRELDRCDSIRIRCGGLPVEPIPPLNYMKLFSINGLINEYVEPCRVLQDGLEMTVEALSGLETVEFPEPFQNMEAFYTSGGSSTLTRSLGGLVRNLDYKTVRYPGHRNQMRTLTALGMASGEPIDVEGRPVRPRDVLAALLERALPALGVDVTLFRVEADGLLEGRAATIRYQLIDYADSEAGLSSMMRCTGFPAAAVARLLDDGTIAQRGVLRQESVVPADRLTAELAHRGIAVKRSLT